jgi:hypothetical protein
MTAPVEPADLQALTAFTVTVGYHLNQTIMDVYPAGAAQPVARIVKDGPIRARVAYQVLAGPGLSQPAGQVSPSGALRADGSPAGIVNLSGGKVPDAKIHPMSGARHSYVEHSPTRWHIAQPSLPPLTGRAANLRTRLCFNRLADLVRWIGFIVWPPDLVVPLTFRFDGPGSAGFTVRRPALRARFDVTADDPRLDRRLILACLAAMAAGHVWVPKRELVDMASPFRR